MRDFRKYCYFLLISLAVLPSFSEAKHPKHRLPAIIVGSVSCDTSKTAHFISGATVSVQCNVDGAFKAITKTNKQGKFKLALPLSISTRPEPDLIKGCRVTLLKSSEPYCAVASSTATSSSIRHLGSQKHSRVFSAGHFAFKPIKQQRPGVARSNDDGIKSQKNFLDPITNGPLLGLGPIVQPVIPQFPPLFGLPNPLQPPSTPSFGFPGSSTPSFGFPGSSTPSFGNPGLPGLTPSPPAFPIPFPPSVPNSARKASP